MNLTYIFSIFVFLSSFCYAKWDRQLVAIEWGGDLYAFDQTYNPAMITSFYRGKPRPELLFNMNNLAQTPDGLLWTTASTVDSPKTPDGGRIQEWLVSYSLLTQEITRTRIVGITTLASVRSMVYLHGGFYAFHASRFGHFDLYKISKTGEATLLQTDMFSSAQNLANDNKYLYVWGERIIQYTVFQGMFRVNPLTLEVEQLFQGKPHVQILLQALCINDGKFYAYGDVYGDGNWYRDSLFLVNIETGEYEVLKSYQYVPLGFGADVRGMQWIRPQKYVPEEYSPGDYLPDIYILDKYLPDDRQ